MNAQDSHLALAAGRRRIGSARLPTWILGVVALAVAAILASTAIRATELDPEEWALFRARFITPDGRVVDTGNQGISHSEGQGYGMLLAVAYDDPATFDRLWSWTRQHLQIRGDHLFAWKYDPSAASDPTVDLNNATDGDLLIAWALARGGEEWQRSEQVADAARIAGDVLAKAVVRTGEQTVLLPGAEGFTRNGVVTVNLSYWLFPAFAALEQVHPSMAWERLTASGLRLLDQARFGPLGLPPDWLDLGDPPRPAAGFAPVFGYNAIRIPLHLVWAGLGTAERLRPYLALDESQPGPPPATVHLVEARANAEPLSQGGQAILSLARQVLGGPEAALPPLTNDLDYFASSLLLLTKLANSEGASS